MPRSRSKKRENTPEGLSYGQLGTSQPSRPPQLSSEDVQRDLKRQKSGNRR